MNNNFRTLNLAIEFHHHCQKIKMKSYLKNQLERASSSVALNLSEGNARATTHDRRRFFQIAYASLKESETALRLAGVASADITQIANRLGGAIYKLIQNCV